MKKQETLILVKPDMVMRDREQKDIIRNIIRYYENAGLEVVERKSYWMSPTAAREFYREHEGRHYFEGLQLAMISGACAAFILRGDNAIAKAREINGSTDPKEAKPGTIRHDFKSAGGPFNVVHASDSKISFDRESQIIFGYRAK